jgi:hypothetical protein
MGSSGYGYYYDPAPKRKPKPKPWDSDDWPSKHPDRYVPLEPPPDEAELMGLYNQLRHHTEALEALLGRLDERPGNFTTDDLKRLDKAVTVAKVGFKMVKRVLRKRGFRGRLKDITAIAPFAMGQTEGRC